MPDLPAERLFTLTEIYKVATEYFAAKEDSLRLTFLALDSGNYHSAAMQRAVSLSMEVAERILWARLGVSQEELEAVDAQLQLTEPGPDGSEQGGVAEPVGDMERKVEGVVLAFPSGTQEGKLTDN